MFDKNEELINVVDPENLLENTQSQELNGLITTIVSAPYSKELESAFYIGSRDIDDNNIFWLYKVDKRTKENNNIILNGTYSLFDDLKAYDVIRDKRPSNASALVGINTVLEGSRWQVGNITSTHAGTANWYFVSRLEAFWEYLENWNVEFKPRMTFSQGKVTGRYIDIIDKRSADYGKWYEHGDKLLQVIAEQASDSLYTAFIGRGKGEESGNGYGRRIGFEKVVWTTASGKPVDKPLNQDYVEIPSATELYGYSDGKPRMTVVIFEDIEDPVQLIQQTYDYALEECRPKLQLKANVLEDGVSELGETCTIVRDDRGIRYKTRVFKLTRNFLNKKQRTVEFGDEIVQSTAKRNSNTAKVIKKQEQQFIAWMDALQLELLDSYFNEDGYNYDLKADNEYDLPGGFYSFNAPIDQNPTKVIYMGAGTLAIANSKTPDGQWNFRTWGTGDGFTADLINAGTLNSININSSTITNSFDLPYLDARRVGTIILEKDMRINYTMTGSGQYGYSYFRPEEISSHTFNSGGTELWSFDLNSAGLNISEGTASASYKSSSIEFKGAGNFPTRMEFNNERVRVELSSYNGVGIGSRVNGVYSSRLAVGGGTSGSVAPFVDIYAKLNMQANIIDNVSTIYLRNTVSSTSGSRLYNSNDNWANLAGRWGVTLGHISDSGNTVYARAEFGVNDVKFLVDLNMNGNTILNNSDIRLKKNVIDTDLDAISLTEKQRVINFEWDETNPYNKDKPEGVQFGLEAQYAGFMAVKDSKSNYLFVDMNAQVNLNTLANQQIIKRLKAAEEKIKQLEG